MTDDKEMKIVRCTNGVGEWEIQPTHETFDTRKEAEEALAKYTEDDEEKKKMKEEVIWKRFEG